MDSSTSFKTWMHQIQQNFSIWGLLILWFCSAMILLGLMEFFAQG